MTSPVAVLGESQGELMADLYTGYNAITVPGRRRAGCLAHARRKVFEAKANVEAQAALDIIRDIYVIEHDVREAASRVPPIILRSGERRRDHSWRDCWSGLENSAAIMAPNPCSAVPAATSCAVASR